MSLRSRLVLAVSAGAGVVAMALPMTASSVTAGLPFQVGVTQDGRVCYSASSDGSNAHCTPAIVD